MNGSDPLPGGNSFRKVGVAVVGIGQQTMCRRGIPVPLRFGGTLLGSSRNRYEQYDAPQQAQDPAGARRRDGLY